MKKFLFVLIITIALILGVSCDGSGPAAPVSNNSSGNGSAAKTVCYVYQHPLIDADKTLDDNLCAFTADTTLVNNSNRRYLLNFDGGKRDIIEKTEDTNTCIGWVRPRDLDDLSGTVLENFDKEHDIYDYWTQSGWPNPTEAQLSVFWTSAFNNTHPNCAYTWGHIVKIGETDTKVFYAVCPLIGTYSKDSPTGYIDYCTEIDSYSSLNAYLYFYITNIESVDYVETINGIEYYNVAPQAGDVLKFKALDNTFTYSNPKEDITLTYAQLTENGWNNGVYKPFDANQANTVFTSYDWVYNKATKWTYGLNYIYND